MYLTVGELVSKLSNLSEDAQVLIPALDGFISGKVKITDHDHLVILEGKPE